jgi:hypothetical protein
VQGQRRAAVALLEALSQRGDSLIAWHLLGSPDAQVAAQAHSVLAGLVGRPEGVATAPDRAPDAREREVWLRHLYEAVWTRP